ncbi:hypothetical protein [Chitiniphilus eburneus]|uniref:4Fe-4S ferredoxin-type domain-containing protein n=1 Tax=Chitiniphilus eburneus TaxID=2571148 RepID=A0A4U0QCN1_9NEIS|nr:hypothetical protein [Chitiniphilus eburneus]TJZ79066.1 hypothetical protein FAZ21_01925 [Chitiniphilus eburneus]
MTTRQALHRFSEGGAALLVSGALAVVAASMQGGTALWAGLCVLPCVVVGVQRFRLGVQTWLHRDGRCAGCGRETEFCPTDCYTRYDRCPHCDLGNAPSK